MKFYYIHQNDKIYSIKTVLDFSLIHISSLHSHIFNVSNSFLLNRQSAAFKPNPLISGLFIALCINIHRCLLLILIEWNIVPDYDKIVYSIIKFTNTICCAGAPTRWIQLAIKIPNHPALSFFVCFNYIKVPWKQSPRVFWTEPQELADVCWLVRKVSYMDVSNFLMYLTTGYKDGDFFEPTSVSGSRTWSVDMHIHIRHKWKHLDSI